MEANKALKMLTMALLAEAGAPPGPGFGLSSPPSLAPKRDLAAHLAVICLIQGSTPVAGRSYPTVSRCSRFRSKAKHTKHHSPAAASSPRNENWRKPNTSFTIPITGSTVHFRSR